MIKFSIYILVLTLLLCSCYSSQDCVCPDYFSPVCGDNGKTYPNPCSADCDGVTHYDGECPVLGIGEVQYTGDTICGFIIRIFQEDYKPKELDEIYLQDGLIISLRYRKLNEYFTCENPYGHYRQIEILEVFD
ncbi:MAG: hypothetical protein K9G76_07310 [Bacteroidales bacterium]|nr:hypothetical protein [Bacteroidales bacterium]MCF8404595.1 hypothetical protein [Bacteroidales bacterium]